MFDEFEKVYPRRPCEDYPDSSDGEKPRISQDSILTVLDGVFSSRKLFVLTCNDRRELSSYLKNRPGRLYYMIEFFGLDVEFITEYCLENLRDQSRLQEVTNLSYLFEDFNFDMLQALVEEMNRYGESATSAVQLLNIKAFDEFSSTSYSATLFLKGKEITLHPSHRTLNANPLMNNQTVYYDSNHSKQGDKENWVQISFQPSHFVSLTKDKEMVFKNPDEFELRLVKNTPRYLNYTEFL
jgi:hypothetical protein